MGTIPSEVGLLTGLSYLDLSINSLKGGLPSELALLSGLTRLDLSSNYFVGTLPTAHHKASAVISSSLASENASPLNVFTETAAAAAASRSSMAAKIEEVGCDNIPEPTTAQTRRFYPSIQFC